MTKHSIISLSYNKFKVPSHWTLADIRQFIGMAAELSSVNYHYSDGEHYHYAESDTLAVSSYLIDMHDNRKAAERAAKRASVEKQLASEE